MAQRKITDHQKDGLLDLIQANHRIIFGKFQGDMGNKIRAKKWAEIVEKMDAFGHPKKDLEQWKRVQCENILFIMIYFVSLDMSI